MLRQYFTTCPQLKLSDPEATARILLVLPVHFYDCARERMRDIKANERERPLRTW